MICVCACLDLHLGITRTDSGLVPGKHKPVRLDRNSFPFGSLMTIIAYQNGIMAADGRVHADDTICTDDAVKIIANAGWVGGAAGYWTDVMAFLEWMQTNRRRKFRPKSDDFEALLVSPRGEIFYIDGEGARERVTGNRWAIGSGWQFAIGAMAAGSTAQEAVEIACKFVTTCGGKITTLRVGKQNREC